MVQWIQWHIGKFEVVSMILVLLFGVLTYPLCTTTTTQAFQSNCSTWNLLRRNPKIPPKLYILMFGAGLGQILYKSCVGFGSTRLIFEITLDTAPMFYVILFRSEIGWWDLNLGL